MQQAVVIPTHLLTDFAFLPRQFCFLQILTKQVYRYASLLHLVDLYGHICVYVYRYNNDITYILPHDSYMYQSLLHGYISGWLHTCNLWVWVTHMQMHDTKKNSQVTIYFHIYIYCYRPQKIGQDKITGLNRKRGCI